ncbi:MAG: T9SS type A sorting domain-containing protein [Lewinellaceae bacterium]|nr:T9SS type A sorting domain-containing protein [Lewinellaceae bacterium]
MKNLLFTLLILIRAAFYSSILFLPAGIFCQSVTIDTDFIAIFRQDCCGWTGSDGTISIPLQNGKTLWGMGDSFIGEVLPDTSRPCFPASKLVNNTLLLQDGGALSTFFNDTDTSAYIPGADSTILWPGHGIRINDTVYQFFKEYKKPGLASAGVRLVKLDVDSLSIQKTAILPDMDGIIFGQFVYQEDGFIYIFGTRHLFGGLIRTPCLARIPSSQALDDFGTWEFYNGSGWSPDASEANSLFLSGESVSATYSVIKLGGRYHLISQDNFLGPKINKWSASQITGPYTGKTAIYNTQPFRDYNGCSLLTYNAMAHPQFVNEQGMLLSFNVIPDRNASCSVSYCGLSCCPPCSICLHPLVFKNADTYRPKFIRVPPCFFVDLYETKTDTICEGEFYTLPDGSEVSQAGAYEVTLQTAAGCDSTILVNLSVNPAPTPGDTIIVGDNGMSNGCISPQFMGGAPPFEYEWSTGDTTLSIVNLSAGTYTVTVMDDNNCAFEFSFEAPETTSAEEPGAPRGWARIVGETDSGRYEYATAIIPAEDGAFWLAGQWQDSALLMMVNSCGEVRWRKTYSYGTVSRLNGLARLGAGGLLAAGYCEGCDPVDTTRKLLVIYTGLGGNLLADTLIGLNGRKAEAAAVTATSDGGAAISGTQVTNTTWGFTDLLFLRVGHDFSFQHYHSFNGANYEYAPALIHLADGGFALGGWSRAPLFGSDYAFVHRLDPGGNLLWAFNSTVPKTQFRALCQADNGNLYATGSHYLDSGQKEDIYLAGIGLENGQLLWDRHYGGTGPDYGRALHAVDGGLLLGAEYHTPRLPNYGASARVYKLDYQGEVQDSSYFDGFLFSYLLRSLIPLTSDGRDYLIAGTHAFFYYQDIFFYQRSRQGYRSQVEAMPQDLSLQSSPVVISGSVTGCCAFPYSQARLRIFHEDSLSYEEVQNLNYGGGQAEYYFSWAIPPASEPYTFRLEGLFNGEYELEAQACGIVSEGVNIAGEQGGGQAESEWPADSYEQQAALFPNPNNGEFSLRLPEETRAVLYNAMGQVVYSGLYAAGTQAINIRHLPSGVYLLLARSQKKTWTFRLLKN